MLHLRCDVRLLHRRMVLHMSSHGRLWHDALHLGGHVNLRDTLLDARAHLGLGRAVLDARGHLRLYRTVRDAGGHLGIRHAWRDLLRRLRKDARLRRAALDVSSDDRIQALHGGCCRRSRHIMMNGRDLLWIADHMRREVTAIQPRGIVMGMIHLRASPRGSGISGDPCQVTKSWCLPVDR